MAKGIKYFGGNGRRSTCVVHGGLIYTSGRSTVNLEGDIKEQTEDVLSQIDDILKARGSDKTKILSVDITLRSMQDYGDFNDVWDRWVIDGFEPCRNVSQGELPLEEYKVKISVIAAE